MSFEEVYEREFAPLFRYVHRSMGDPDAAADVTQEAFVRYLASRVPEAEARPWLFRVASNLVRDQRRRRGSRARLAGRLAGERDAATGPAEAERRLVAGRVRAALDELSDRDRQMLLMREEGFSYDEIARAVEVSPTSVGALLVRARRRFRESYERA